VLGVGDKVINKLDAVPDPSAYRLEQGLANHGLQPKLMYCLFLQIKFSMGHSHAYLFSYLWLLSDYKGRVE